MSVIDDYLKNYSNQEKTSLELIRKLVHQLVPEAEEVITYSIPGFKYKNKYLVAFGVSKNHLGFYPTSSPIEEFKDKLTDFKTSRGAIQFTPNNPLPESLIKDIVLYRVNQINQSQH